MPKSRLLTVVFPIVPLLAAVGILLPFALWAASQPFPQRTAGTLLFLAICTEKIWAMYFRMRRTGVLKPQRDWTAVTIGLAHTLIMYAVIGEYYLRRAGITHAGWTAGGAVLYLAALYLRYAAFRALKHQWAVHVDKSYGPRRLVRTGPYRWIRHPLYLGACLEVAGIPLMLNAFWTAAVGLCVFVPLEVGRTFSEEEYLRGIFGKEYTDYASETAAFLPPPWRRHRRRSAGKGRGSTAATEQEDQNAGPAH